MRASAAAESLAVLPADCAREQAEDVESVLLGGASWNLALAATREFEVVGFPDNLWVGLSEIFQNTSVPWTRGAQSAAGRRAQGSAPIGELNSSGQYGH